MTRVLSELLGAREPLFQLNLRQLEGSAGRPNADIRLTTEVQRELRAKLCQLNLDSEDTTGQELYTALGARLALDEERFAAALRASAQKSDDVVGSVAFMLGRELRDISCFSMKSTTAKRLLKANLPKKTMKLLGYRSADSMFKHESVSSLFAASWLAENEQWAKKLVAGYAKLKPADFEIKKIAIDHPSSKRWQDFSREVVAEKRHNTLAFKELGAVVLLPLPDEGPQPKLPALSTAVLALQAVNEVAAASAYLKLHQVRHNFGQVVVGVVTGEPALDTRLLDQPVSWNLMQQYYARFKDVVKADVFEPLVQTEDLIWQTVEDVLTRVEPSLSFWQGTHHLGLLKDGSVTSCNLTDNVLSHGSGLPYAGRVLDFFRSGLMTELLLRYMGHDRVEQTVTADLQKQLNSEPVTAV